MHKIYKTFRHYFVLISCSCIKNKNINRNIRYQIIIINSQPHQRSNRIKINHITEMKYTLKIISQLVQMKNIVYISSEMNTARM